MIKHIFVVQPRVLGSAYFITLVLVHLFCKAVIIYDICFFKIPVHKIFKINMLIFFLATIFTNGHAQIQTFPGQYGRGFLRSQSIGSEFSRIGPPESRRLTFRRIRRGSHQFAGGYTPQVCVYKSFLFTQKSKFYVKLHMIWFVYIFVSCLFTFFRRSRIPSEEDDKLFNFLQTGGLDPSRERNTSLGNLVAESQQNYGTYTHFHEFLLCDFF